MQAQLLSFVEAEERICAEAESESESEIARSVGEVAAARKETLAAEEVEHERQGMRWREMRNTEVERIANAIA